MTTLTWREDIPEPVEYVPVAHMMHRDSLEAPVKALITADQTHIEHMIVDLALA